MKQSLQPTLFGLAISLILTAFSINAEPPKTATSEVTYRYYYHTEEIHRRKYHPFLPALPSEELRYQTRTTATANIDDTPDKENIVLIVVDTKHEAPFGEWSQAFLLITEGENEGDGFPKKRNLFKLFDAAPNKSDVLTEVIELHPPPFLFKELTDISFRLTDVTGDGILDIWIESAYGVALISFQNGKFVEVFTNYTITREKLTETPEVEYHYYGQLGTDGDMYHRFLPTPPPEMLSYSTRMIATANIDNTPEKETIVLMVTHPKGRVVEWGEWNQAFLLITDTQADGFPKKKDLFKLFTFQTYPWDVPTKTIAVQSAPFIFRDHKLWSGAPWDFKWVSFRLVDLTGDGILDIWVEHAYGVAVVSFQEGEFVEVCSVYTSIKREDPIEYIDLDNDGIYEIKIPDRISIEGPTAAYPHWMSLYEWDRNTYVLNNKRFYAHNDEFLTRLLDRYTTWSRYSRNQEYHFYIGLVYFYRDNIPKAREYLQWVLENGKGEGYIHAAEDLLKKLPSH